MLCCRQRDAKATRKEGESSVATRLLLSLLALLVSFLRSMQPLPAHQTKHLPSIDYSLPSGQVVQLKQAISLENDSTGRTLWLGAQVLAVYLNELLGATGNRRKTCIDLGSGTGASLFFRGSLLRFLLTVGLHERSAKVC